MSKDKKKYWFKHKRYGYGWTPTTWQGWLVILIYAIGIVAASIILLPTSSSDEDVTTGQLVAFFVILGFSIAFLLAISYAKGPKPKWR